MSKSTRPPTYKRRRDDNHVAVRDGLKGIGWNVLDTGAVGNGVPDLLVWRERYDGVLFRAWVEVKTEKEYRGEFNGLTPKERLFFEYAPGAKIIATSAEHAQEQLLKLMGGDVV